MKIKTENQRKLEDFLEKKGKKIKKAFDKNKKLVLKSSHRSFPKKEDK